MKRIITMVLVIISAFIYAQDFEEYFKDSKIIKEIESEYKIIDFTIAKTSENIAYLSRNGNSIRLHYLDKDGQELWTKDFKLNSYHLNLELSENGVAIVIQSQLNDSPEYYDSIVINNEGKLLFQKQLHDIVLMPSPQGSFFFEKIGIFGNKNKHLIIYNQEGTKLSNLFKEELIKPQAIFLREDKVLINHSQRKISLFSLEQNKLNLEWDYEINEANELFNHFYQSITFGNNKIVIANPNIPFEMRILDLSGEEVYKDHRTYQYLSFLGKTKLLLGSPAVNRSEMKILDTQTFKVEYLDFDFSSIYKSSSRLVKAFFKKNTLMVTMQSSSNYSTYIYDLSENTFIRIDAEFNPILFSSNRYITFDLKSNSLLVRRRIYEN